MGFRKTSSILLFALFAAYSSCAPAQTSANRAKSRTANTISGSLGAVDAATATVGIRAKTGKETLFRYTEKTRVWKEKKPAAVVDIKTGESVVARFRKSAVGPATLYDLADAASWAWLDRLRHETTRVTVKEVDDENLHATEGADGAEFAFRVTDKTQWSKAGAPAAPADFKPGDSVYVVPRLLPGGGTMALAVADAPTDAAKLKERSRFTVSGTISAWNGADRAISLHTATQDDRKLILLPDCVVRLSGKDMPVTSLRLGQSVTLHLTRDENGEQVVKQVTIKPKTGTKKLPGRPPSKPAVKKPNERVNVATIRTE